MAVQLPEAISAFLTAANAADSAALLDCFAENAMVIDVRREFLGRAEIKRWSDNEIFPDNVVQTVEDVREHFGDFIVLLKVDGDFDKTNLSDPLLLTGYFTLRGDKIVRLIIIEMLPSHMSLEEVLAL
ncbi:nuclear transport factor 2 family protein [Saccharopolyspora sp. 5N708]|uniref:nuclear transport factor 2 family protein n=1 Tax=Saccharopolyspora sp. 5N708 TaxID=3457424 RepID=UPI003FD1D327